MFSVLFLQSQRDEGARKEIKFFGRKTKPGERNCKSRVGSRKVESAAEASLTPASTTSASPFPKQRPSDILCQTHPRQRSSLDPALCQSRHQSTLHDKADENRRQCCHYPGGSDQPVIGDAAAGEVSNGDSESLGPLIGGEKQGVE